MSIKTKRIILCSLYGTICLTFVISILFVKSFINPKQSKVPNSTIIDLKPVNKIIDDNTLTVFEDTNTLNKPFLEKDVQIGLNFYNLKDNKENQENSIIYYQDTYMPSTGVFYKKDSKFDVISIYNGKVLEITKSDLLGNIIKVDYGNNLVGLYQCVDDIKVKVGDNIITGSILATSSTCNIFKDKGNGLYLEIIHNGKNINPEYYYGKTLEEL